MLTIFCKKKLNKIIFKKNYKKLVITMFFEQFNVKKDLLFFIKCL